MPTRDPTSRVADLCEECGKVDSDPKHHELRGPILDGRGGIIEPARFVSRHLDCCAARGCVALDGHPAQCATVLQTAKDAKGEALVTHLRKRSLATGTAHDSDEAELARQKAKR